MPGSSRHPKFPNSVWEPLTRAGEDEGGLGSGERVLQRPTPHVAVETSHGAAQLGQRQPGPYVGRFIGEEDGDGPTRLELQVPGEHTGSTVAPAFDVFVGVNFILEAEQGPAGLAANVLLEDIEEGDGGLAVQTPLTSHR